MNISEFCKIYTGTGFPIEFQGKKDGKYPFYKVSDISASNAQQKIFLGSANNYIDEFDVSMLKGNIIPAGTIVFAKIGEALKLNKRAITSCECLIDNNVIGIKPDDNIINLLYFYYYLLKIDMIHYSESTTLPSVRKSTIEKIEVKIPPIDVQNKRVSILNLCYETIKYKVELLYNLELLVKSRFVEMFGDPVINNKNWFSMNLGEISIKISSGNTPQGGSRVYTNHGILFIRSQNVWNNRLDLADVVYISESLNEKMKETRLRRNDLLITKTGRFNTENSSLGRCALYTGSDFQANINGHVYLVRLKVGYNPNFILSILTSEAYKNLIRTVCVGGIDKRQLNKFHIESFPIIIPPVELQNQYVQFLLKINKLKSDVQKSIDETQLLMNSLMQEYFG